MKPVVCLALCALFGCQTGHVAASGARGHLIAPSSQVPEVVWSEAERAQTVAMRNLRRSAEASFHLLRVTGAQEPQVHRQSDLVLMTMAGSVSIRLDGAERRALAPGDVVEIPRGTAYDLEGARTAPAVLYLVHTPPLAAGDTTSVDGSTRRDAWQWNVWVQ